MNALNLGTQPEHRQLHSRDELEAAAMMYGLCKESLLRAMPMVVTRIKIEELTRNMIEAKIDLEEAAIRYFENNYNGATE